MFLHEIHCLKCKLNYRSSRPCADSNCPGCGVNGRRDGWLVSYSANPGPKEFGPMSGTVERT